MCDVTTGIEVKDVALRPHVRRVPRDVHGHVAYDADPPLVGVCSQVAPLTLELVLETAMALEAGSDLRILGEGDRVAAIPLGPRLPGCLVIEVLDGPKDRIRGEPVRVVATEAHVAWSIVDVRKAFEHRLGIILEKRHVSGKCREPRVGRTKFVGWIYRQHLPVGLATFHEPVHEAASWFAKRAGAATVGKRRHVRKDAHPGRKGLLEQRTFVEAQHRRAQRPEEDACLPVLHLGGTARDDVIHATLDHGHPDGVRMLEACIDEHAYALAVILAPEAEHVLACGKWLEATVQKYRQGLSQGDGIAIDGSAIVVAAAPGEGGAVIRVAETLETTLVPVVHAGNAGERHLQERHEPQT